MNETNLLWATVILASFTHTNSLRTTNWVDTGDSAIRGRTNLVDQWMSEITVTEKVVTPTIVWVTNPTPVRVSRELFSKTNAIIRQVPRPLPPLPIEARGQKE